jgi:pyrimidine operon attenuation protein / uracil phosphoribosyltransferase
MDPRVLLTDKGLEHTLNRLCFELIENYQDFENTVFISLQPRGKYLGERIEEIVFKQCGVKIPHGILDITFFRDDFRRSERTIEPNQTKIDFLIEGKKVIMIDDVLYSGRSVRSGMDALLAYGRPEKVELLVLIDRKLTRHLPIAPNYVGRTVNTLDNQRVSVEWGDVEGEDKVVLLNQ